MSKFIEIEIKPKNIPPQSFEARKITINTDAILAFKPFDIGTFSITLKPEYEQKIIEASVGSARQGLEYIYAKESAIKTLL